MAEDDIQPVNLQLGWTGMGGIFFTIFFALELLWFRNAYSRQT